MRQNKVIGICIGVMVLCCLIIGISTANGDSVKKRRLNRLHNLFFIPQSSSLVSNCGSEPEGSIRFWSIEAGQPSGLEQLGDNKYAWRIALSHDGNFIAAAFLDNTIGYYSIKGKKWLWKVRWLKEEPGGAREIMITPDDSKVIAVGVKNTVIYDTKTGDSLERQTKPLSDYPFWWGGPRGNVLSSSGNYLVAWQELPDEDHRRFWQHFSLNKSITLWDIKENKLLGKWEKAEHELTGAVFTPDEKHILFSYVDDYIRVWSIAEQKIVKEWKAHWNDKYPDISAGIDWMTFSPDGQFLALFGAFAVRIWDYPAGKLVHEFKRVTFNAQARGVYPMVFSPDNKYFAFEQNGQLCLYDINTWGEVWCVLSYPEDKRMLSN